MTIKLDIQMTGLKEFEANLKILRDQFQVRTGGLINRSLMAGARIIRDEAKAKAPIFDSERARRAFKSRRFNQAGRGLSQSQEVRVPRNLKSNIVASYAKGMPLTVLVRVRTRTYIFEGGRGNFKSNVVGNPNYWWLVEFGTSKMAARPFMRPAFEAKKSQALGAFTVEMRKQLTEQFRKFRPNLKMAA